MGDLGPMVHVNLRRGSTSCNDGGMTFGGLSKLGSLKFGVGIGTNVELARVYILYIGLV